jgi:hypothetical protein
VTAAQRVGAAAAAKMELMKMKVSGVVPSNGQRLTAKGTWKKKAMAKKN